MAYMNNLRVTVMCDMVTVDNRLYIIKIIWNYVYHHQVKYRMEGNKARTTSLYDGEAREIAHVKRVSDLISKVRYLIYEVVKENDLNVYLWLFNTSAAAYLPQVLYRQKWDETKDRYLLPPDAPELVLAVKNAANYSKVSPMWNSGTEVYFQRENFCSC